jgi:hypothetical protein
MQREFTLNSAATPDALFNRLRDLGTHLPPAARFRPAHVTGMQVKISPPRFWLQCTRTYREFSGPVCDGRIVPVDSGSVLSGKIRRNRGFLLAPLVALPILLYAWLGRSNSNSAGLVALLFGALLLAGWSLLVSLFSTDKHEAEVDALLALVRRAAEPASDDQAGV